MPNLLNEATNSKFVTRKWNIVNVQSNTSYAIGHKIIYSTEVLKSNPCNFNDDYILVRGDITILGRYAANQVTVKNCGPFTKCKPKPDGTTTDDVEDLDLLKLMYNLLEYSSDYFDKTDSSWFYPKDEAINFNAHIGNTDVFKSFKYKAKLLTNADADGANGILRNPTVAVPLKYRNYFSRSLEMPSINYKVEVKLKWTNYYVLSAAGADNDNIILIILFLLSKT